MYPLFYSAPSPIKGDTGLPGSQGVPGPAISWEMQTSAFTAVAFHKYACNTAGGSFTATLPASPNIGDEIVFLNTASLLINTLTLGRNGSTINGSVANLVLTLIAVGITTLVCIAPNTWRTAP